MFEVLYTIFFVSVMVSFLFILGYFVVFWLMLVSKWLREVVKSIKRKVWK